MLGGDNYSFDYGRPDIFFELNRIALEHDLPIAIWGASVGPFSIDPEFEFWAAKELSKIPLICARETATQDYLASIGVEQNVILSADPAFYLEPSALKLPADVERALAEGCVGLNLSPLVSRFVDLSGSPQAKLHMWTQAATEVIRNLLERFSEHLLLIPHVTSETGEILRDDYVFLRQVAQRVQAPEQLRVLGPNLNAAQTKWVIGRLRAFSGARTHSTLAAISSGVPTVCLGYSMKARGIVKDVYGNLDWLIDIKELINDPSALSERLVSLFDQESEIRSHLECMNSIFRQRVNEATKHFLNTIEQGI